METLDDIIYGHMKANGVNVNGMADLLGIKPTALYNYRQGTRAMPHLALFRLAQLTKRNTLELIAIMEANLVTTPEEEREIWVKSLTRPNVGDLGLSVSYVKLKTRVLAYVTGRVLRANPLRLTISACFI